MFWLLHSPPSPPHTLLNFCICLFNLQGILNRILCSIYVQNVIVKLPLDLWYTMTATLILESVWVLCQDEAIELVRKDPFLITNYNLIKKWIIWIFQMQYWIQFNMWKSLTSTFMWNSFIKFLHQANFHQIVWYCWNADTHNLRHFFDTWIWVLFD